jgi:hypothetical protein
MKNYLTIAAFVFFVFSGCDNSDSDDSGPSVINGKITTNDLLSATKYENLVVEIQFFPGHAPTTAAVTNLKNFLEARLNKPGGITITQTEIASTGKSAYSADDIRTIEKANRKQSAADKTVTTYFLFVDGDYAGNSGSSKVLGIAYGATSMAIFEKTVKDYSGGLGEPSETVLESTVILHEFGHILGLVNNGTSLQSAHQDTAHGKHCTNEDCLMYYTAETSDIIANLVGGGIPTLDAACVADLQANGGK